MMQAQVIRVLDVLASAAGLVVLSPIIVVLMLALRLSSSGPVIFAQTRVGRHERSFTCFKLRTMAVGTPNAGSHEVSAAAVTPLGHVLRRLKLDELPQLWNVLLGDMSLVGPRPGLPIQLELLNERRRRGIYNVRPGVTGPAQVAGIDMSQPAKLAALDETFASNPSLTAYFTFIFKTLVGHGRGDRVGV